MSVPAMNSNVAVESVLLSMSFVMPIPTVLMAVTNWTAHVRKKKILSQKTKKCNTFC